MYIKVNIDILNFLLIICESLLLYTLSCICFVHSTKYLGEFFVSVHVELPMLVLTITWSSIVWIYHM